MKKTIVIAMLLALPGMAAAQQLDKKSPVTVTPQLDKTAIWVGDNLRYTIRAIYAPNVEMVLDNFTKERLPLAPFILRDIDIRHKDWAGSNKAVEITLTLTTFETGKDSLTREAARASVARAATLVTPDAKLAKDAPELIAAMLAGGYDEAAARWIPAVNSMDDEEADRCWAMLALAAPNVADVGTRRVNSFIRRDKSQNHVRSALLVAGLAGLGRISADDANALNRRYGLGLGHNTSWTQMIDAAAGRAQGATVLVLTGTGFQTSSFDHVPASHLYHAIMALSRTGQQFTARMIAAEALSRT